ncbi:hypothetical protein SETIT_6G111000v2 [Setaria italica]|uniref:WW domain-containing protein n=1 Tax=Setaria italica TaxID=4555 RepID=A0A368RKN7_SETIT|nr:hypothetical protein SETIT_6G111000v2 [Setaria italica]
MAAQEAAADASGPRFAPDDPTLPAPWKALIDGATVNYWNPGTNVTQNEKPGAAAAAPPRRRVLHQQPLRRFRNPHQGFFHSLACSLAKLVGGRTRSAQAWAPAAQQTQQPAHQTTPPHRRRSSSSTMPGGGEDGLREPRGTKHHVERGGVVVRGPGSGSGGLVRHDHKCCPGDRIVAGRRGAAPVGKIWSGGAPLQRLPEPTGSGLLGNGRRRGRGRCRRGWRARQAAQRGGLLQRRWRLGGEAEALEQEAAALLEGGGPRDPDVVHGGVRRWGLLQVTVGALAAAVVVGVVIEGGGAGGGEDPIQ